MIKRVLVQLIAVKKVWTEVGVGVGKDLTRKV